MIGRGRPLEGRHVLYLLLAAFGVTVLANLALAFASLTSFPGMEVRNGYIASQFFERDRALQEQLGWVSSAAYAGNELQISLEDASGGPAALTSLDVRIGRPTHGRSDAVPVLRFNGSRYVADIRLGTGSWNVDIEAVSQGGIPFRQRLEIWVPAGGR